MLSGAAFLFFRDLRIAGGVICNGVFSSQKLVE